MELATIDGRRQKALSHLAKDGTYVWDRLRHLAVNLSISGWLEREFPHAELFVYKHLETGRFMVGRWVSKGSGRFVPLLEIGVCPADFTADRAVELRRRVADSNQSAAALKMAIAAESNQAARDAEQEHAEFADMNRFLRNSSHNKVQRDHPLLRAAAGL